MPNSFTRTPAEQYGIDFNVKLRELLPYFWEYTIGSGTKKTAFMDFTEVIFGQLAPTNANFILVVEFVRDRMAYTGQVLSLVTLLNNKYDNTLRRISIQCLNNNFVEGIDIYNNNEVDPTPVILFNNFENNFGLTITLFNNAEVQDPNSLYGKSFIVNVPNDVTATDVQIRALLNVYVIAPQSYLIQRF